MKMKSIYLLINIAFICGCKQGKSEKKEIENQTINITQKQLTKVTEENYNVKSDSLIFSSSTIENFDKNGNSIDVYWIGEERDTILKFYRKYDVNMKLIGAEYFEEGDTEPSRDTVFIDNDGRRVEASLDVKNNIKWKSTIHQDDNGNEVLKTYENGKGEYRGYDSLYFDKKNRVIKGFYENSKGKRYSIKTYKYLKFDEYGYWIERQMFKDDTLNQKQIRILEYH